MQDIWNSFITLVGKYVSPDWGAAVALIPLGVAAIVGLWLVWLVARLATAPTARRGAARTTPLPPAGSHMPGPSWAPIFAAFGAFFLLFGLIARGVALPIGIVVLLLTLLYWGREAMRDYDRVAAPAGGVPAVVVTGPPPGVHMPSPSFRPILASIAAATLFYGLVFGGALLVVGILMLAISLLGWLVDARAEYRAVEAADRTGHLEALPAPHYPTRTLAAFAVLLVFGIALNAGIVPASNSGGAGASPGGSPAASAGSGGGGGGSAGGGSAGGGSAGGGGPLPSGDVTIKAQNISFDVKTASAPAGKPFTIVFANNDAGTPHNVAIKDSSGADVFTGKIITGPATQTYQVPQLKAGSYTFYCQVHPSMTGTLTVH